jgi:hypothetical protein
MQTICEEVNFAQVFGILKSEKCVEASRVLKKFSSFFCEGEKRKKKKKKKEISFLLLSRLCLQQTQAISFLSVLPLCNSFFCLLFFLQILTHSELMKFTRI